MSARGTAETIMSLRELVRREPNHKNLMLRRLRGGTTTLALGLLEREGKNFFEEPPRQAELTSRRCQRYSEKLQGVTWTLIATFEPLSER